MFYTILDFVAHSSVLEYLLMQKMQVRDTSMLQVLFVFCASVRIIYYPGYNCLKEDTC